MQPTDELYYKYQGVINAVVYNYAWRCPALADELYLQAQYIFCKACLSYDPNHESGASFKTWLVQQLHSLTDLIDALNRGPTTNRVGSTPFLQERSAVTQAAQHDRTGTAKDSHDTLSNIASSWYVKEYGDKFTMDDEGYPERLRPYVENLTGDSLTMFKDFCAGMFDPIVNTPITRSRRLACETLNPLKMYRRHYMAQGWSLDRVRNAWKGLHGMLRNYVLGKKPIVAIAQENAFRKALLF